MATFRKSITCTSSITIFNIYKIYYGSLIPSKITMGSWVHLQRRKGKRRKQIKEERKGNVKKRKEREGNETKGKERKVKQSKGRERGREGKEKDRERLVRHCLYRITLTVLNIFF